MVFQKDVQQLGIKTFRISPQLEISSFEKVRFFVELDSIIEFALLDKKSELAESLTVQIPINSKLIEILL